MMGGTSKSTAVSCFNEDFMSNKGWSVQQIIYCIGSSAKFVVGCKTNVIKAGELVWCHTLWGMHGFGQIQIGDDVSKQQ
jgi:hypothetical protein